MSDQNNTRILELMASKICHDLISPVGAISNGVEILEELGPDAGEDVVSLIAFSAIQANSKLKALRMAYGLGGADSSIRAEEVYKIFGDFIYGEKRLSQEWDPYADLGIPSKDGLAKMLLLLLILVTEALPKGGVISVTADKEDIVLITGSGENAHFREGFIDALEHTISDTDLEPKLVHAYITGLLAKNYNFEITVDDTENDFIFLRLKSSSVS